MIFSGCIFVLSLCHVTLCFTSPIDTVVVQVQVGAQPLMQHVFLNGVVFIGFSQEVNNIIQTMADAALPLSSVNQTAELRNHTVLRSRECILEGSQLHWTDRVFYDGKVHLSLESSGTWTAHGPQAQVLKAKWDQEAERTKLERLRLQEGCIQLMKELKFTQEQVPHIPLPQLLIPICSVLAFTGLFLISLCLSENLGEYLKFSPTITCHMIMLWALMVMCFPPCLGQRHPGGVIGSVIHYPKDIPKETSESKGFGYHTI